MSNFANLNELCKETVKRFLQTVFIADNQPILSTPKNQEPKVATAVAKKPPTIKGAHSQIKDNSEQTQQVSATPVNQTTAEDSSDSHNIDLRSVVNAFAEKGITCGSYLPDESIQTDEIVATTLKVATPTDVAIIDWQLQYGDRTAAVEIVKGLLKADNEKGGRLRLIIIYTGERDLDTEARQLAKDLGSLVQVDQKNERVLLTDHARIRFLNKPRKEYIADADVVNWSDLPERVIQEFAKLTPGLLQAFALEGVAALREDTHHMLAQFGTDLDGAFAGQRATSSDPEDAGQLMLDILLSEFAVSITKDKISERILGKDGSILWLNSQLTLPKLQIELNFHPPREQIKEVEHAQRIDLLTNGMCDGKENKDKPILKVFNAFFNNESQANLAQSKFSILSTLALHGESGTRHVTHCLPIITLGVVIQAVNHSEDLILLCIQPKCDAIRLRKKRGFLFVGLNPDTKCFDLILPISGCYTPVRLNHKDPLITTLQFKPNSSLGTVSSIARENSWEFDDESGNKWRWLAEVRETHVLSFVNKITGNLNRVGLNQSEWLRLQSSK